MYTFIAIVMGIALIAKDLRRLINEKLGKDTDK